MPFIFDSLSTNPSMSYGIVENIFGWLVEKNQRLWKKSTRSIDDNLNELIIPELNNETIESMIYEIRGQKVMLDFELAKIYGYETKAFN